MEKAAEFFENNLTDELTAIIPSGTNTWTQRFSHPGTGATQDVVNPTVAANVMVIYVGGRALSGLGVGGFGGWGAGGTQEWFNTIRGRGQSGASANDASTRDDFAAWGGTISFDTGSTWHVATDGSNPPNGSNDLMSVALHEIGHVVGFGTAASWDNLSTTGGFTGEKSVAEFNGQFPLLQSGFGHWANNTMSVVYKDGAAQETAMDPDITVGTTKAFTNLDMTGLDDLGWVLAAIVTGRTISTNVSRDGSAVTGTASITDTTTNATSDANFSSGSPATFTGLEATNEHSLQHVEGVNQ
jgi:hypothetical protein